MLFFLNVLSVSNYLLFILCFARLQHNIYLLFANQIHYVLRWWEVKLEKHVALNGWSFVVHDSKVKKAT